MKVIGNSPQGQAAFAHFALLLIVFMIYIANFPVRPSEATQQQTVIFEVAGVLLAILVFPIGYIGFLIPKTSEFNEWQLLWLVLIPLNSCLWGYFVVLMIRRIPQAPPIDSKENH